MDVITTKRSSSVKFQIDASISKSVLPMRSSSIVEEPVETGGAVGVVELGKPLDRTRTISYKLDDHRASIMNSKVMRTFSTANGSMVYCLCTFIIMLFRIIKSSI